jgi:hypothetical protein
MKPGVISTWRGPCCVSIDIQGVLGGTLKPD